MENCPSLKTPLVRDVLRNLRVPTIFSAPASFLAIPVEAVFGAIKSVDYSTKCFPPLEPGAVRRPTRTTIKWESLLKVSRYLLNLSPMKVARLFESRLANLSSFILLDKV